MANSEPKDYYSVPFDQVEMEVYWIDVGDGLMEEHRALVFTEAFICSHWGVSGDRVIVQGPNGRVLFVTKKNNAVGVMFIPHVVSDVKAWNDFGSDVKRWNDFGIRFWSTTAELGPLGRDLEKKPDCRVKFDVIFNGELVDQILSVPE